MTQNNNSITHKSNNKSSISKKANAFYNIMNLNRLISMLLLQLRLNESTRHSTLLTFCLIVPYHMWAFGNYSVLESRYQHVDTMRHQLQKTQHKHFRLVRKTESRFSISFQKNKPSTILHSMQLVVSCSQVMELLIQYNWILN